MQYLIVCFRRPPDSLYRKVIDRLEEHYHSFLSSSSFSICFHRPPFASIRFAFAAGRGQTICATSTRATVMVFLTAPANQNSKPRPHHRLYSLCVICVILFNSNAVLALLKTSSTDIAPSKHYFLSHK